jgi:hypothetical protein
VNPIAAPIGRLAASIEVECAANCDAVLFNACPTCPATFVNVTLVAFSISIRLTLSILCTIDMRDQPQTIDNYRRYFHYFLYFMDGPAESRQLFSVDLATENNFKVESMMFSSP